MSEPHEQQPPMPDPDPEPPNDPHQLAAALEREKGSSDPPPELRGDP